MSVPILVVAGFLGAGKTTLINRLLQGDHGQRISAIVNDFGAINIDAELLGDVGDSVIGLKNGCVCCSLQGDLLRTLRRVLGGGRPDLVVIEASGVADPAGIVQGLIDPVIWDAARLEAVVCVVDASGARPDDPLWQAQVRASDAVVLNRAEGDAAALRARLAALGCRTVLDGDGAPPLSALLALAPDERVPARVPAMADGRFVALEWVHDGAVSLAGFQAAMQMLAPTLLRAKGLLSLRDGRRVLFQLAGRRATISAAPPAGQPGCALVLIGEAGTFDREAARHRLDDLSRA